MYKPPFYTYKIFTSEYTACSRVILWREKLLLHYVTSMPGSIIGVLEEEHCWSTMAGSVATESCSRSPWNTKKNWTFHQRGVFLSLVFCDSNVISRSYFEHSKRCGSLFELIRIFHFRYDVHFTRKKMRTTFIFEKDFVFEKDSSRWWKKVFQNSFHLTEFEKKSTSCCFSNLQLKYTKLILNLYL